MSEKKMQITKQESLLKNRLLNSKNTIQNTAEYHLSSAKRKKPLALNGSLTKQFKDRDIQTKKSTEYLPPKDLNTSTKGWTPERRKMVAKGRTEM